MSQITIQRPPQDKDDYDANSQFYVDVLQAVSDEMSYQDEKHGEHKHTPMEWIAIIEGLVNRAKSRFSEGSPDCEALMLSDVRKITATGFACQEQCGYVPRVLPPNLAALAASPSPNAAINEHFDLRKAIEININLYSAENGSNTPDFILAQYLMDCLAAYDKAVTAREKWYGREPKPVPPDQCPPPPDPVGKPFLTSI